MLDGSHGWASSMNLVTGHVVVICAVAVCVTILGMAHVLHGSDPVNIFIACIASFSAHGVTGTLKGAGRGPEGGESNGA